MRISVLTCQFCGSRYVPPRYHRVPSGTCSVCCSKIAEGLRDSEAAASYFPTSHVEECQREPDLSLQSYYEKLLRSLALDDRKEFDDLVAGYLVSNFGVYKKQE